VPKYTTLKYDNLKYKHFNVYVCGISYISMFRLDSSVQKDWCDDKIQFF